MKIKKQSLEDLFVSKLAVLLDVEEQIIEALSKMEKKATDPELKAALENHLEETRMHADRLEKALSNFDSKPKMKSAAIRGLVADAEMFLALTEHNATRDALIIAAAQAVEHHEMAGYGTVIEWARVLGNSEIEELLSETLEEERAADERLSDLAESRINEDAAAGAESGEDEDE